MPKEITSNVEALEAEAQRVLEEAKAKASEILLQAKEEAKKILSSQLSFNETKIQCDGIVSRARAEADKQIKDSQQKAAEIRNVADKKVKEMTQRVVNIVTGSS
ncbi:MAG: hypothetical protein ACUVTR_01525 [Dehalococcoidia bacterium]